MERAKLLLNESLLSRFIRRKWRGTQLNHAVALRSLTTNKKSNPRLGRELLSLIASLVIEISQVSALRLKAKSFNFFEDIAIYKFNNLLNNQN